MMLLKLYQDSAQGADIIIRPEMGHVDMFEGNGREKFMKEGEITARKALPDIQRLLKIQKVV